MISNERMSLAEFESLCDFARELNEYVPPDRVKAPAASAPSAAKGDRPGDEFNRRGSWAEVLEPAGWQVDRTSGDVTYWRRPGKARGCSATTGKCNSDQGGDLLYVFSSNASPFEPEHAYSRFSAYALLHHGGDFTAAGRELVRLGYGSQPIPEVVFGPPAAGTEGSPPDDGIEPDPEFATNADLERFDLGVKWVWERWLQRGVVNLLAAEGGMGKTRFVADLCRRIHTRGSWPDGGAAIEWPGDYLAMWVAGDRNHGELLELSKAFGFGERICYSGSKADPLGGVTLDSPADFRALYRKLKAARPLFLVVDTAGGATGLRMERQEEARKLFSPLADMAARLNLCVIVITHLNASKNTLGRRAEERVRVVVRLTAPDREPETVRRLEVVKSNSLFPAPIGMTLGATGNTYDDAPPAAPEPVGGGADSPEKGPSSKVKECSEWITGELTQVPKRLSEIIELASTKGFSMRVLYQTKEHLKLMETQDKYQLKWWALRT